MNTKIHEIDLNRKIFSKFWKPLSDSMLLLAGFLGFYLVEMKQLKLENEMFCCSVIFQVRTLWINDSNNWGIGP